MRQEKRTCAACSPCSRKKFYRNETLKCDLYRFYKWRGFRPRRSHPHNMRFLAASGCLFPRWIQVADPGYPLIDVTLRFHSKPPSQRRTDGANLCCGLLAAVDWARRRNQVQAKNVIVATAALLKTGVLLAGRHHCRAVLDSFPVSEIEKPEQPMPPQAPLLPQVGCHTAPNVLELK